MNIIFKSTKNESLSMKEREKITALFESQMPDYIDFIIHANSANVVSNWDSSFSLSSESLIRNLVELQHDAVLLEEQLSKLKERNDYLEEKVNWLRGKAGEMNFIPSKAKPESRGGADKSSLQSALVEVVNKMESKFSEKVGLPFSKSKRARKDKALVSKSEYFDKEYVDTQLKQLGLKVKDPLEFFVSFGADLELSPSAKFDTKSYVAMNPDVKDSGINPLLHYIKHGKAEGRVLI